MKLQTPIYRETLKFNLWVSYFFLENHKETYQNATQAAIKAYGYTSPEQYNLASVTGYKNLRKYKFLGVATADMMGFGFAELLKIGIKKALDGSYSDWEALMIRLGYFQEKEIIQQNNQFNQFNFEDMREAIAQSRKERGLTP